MKKNFIRVCTFIFAFTSTVMQVLPTASNPTMSRVYGNQFTPEVPDTQSAGTVGALDGTFGTSGSLAVTNGLTDPQAVGIQALQNGSFLVVLNPSSGDPVVAQYNAEGALNSATYASSSSGLADLGAVAIPRATMLDMQGRLLVAGGADTGIDGWIARVSADGNTVTPFTTGFAWSFVGGIAQQSSGKIIAVGFDGAHALIGRYTIGGVLDASFGYSTGYTIFSGGHSLTSTTGLYSVVVDSSDNIYVLYLEGTAAKVAKFNVDGVLVATFDGVGGSGNGIVPVPYLDSVTASTMRIAMDLANDLVVGASLGSDVLVTSITSATGVAGTVADFSTSVFDTLSAIVPTTVDGKVLLVGSDTITPFNMAVMRLTSVGLLDTTFNPTSGYHLFNIGTPDTAAVLNAAAIAPDGQIYTAGYQINSGTTTPYVSRLYNTQYVAAVAQYPLAVEQGILDQTFGTPATETYAGVTSPFNGLYGSSMMQRATAAVESRVTPVPAGDIIVGMNGFLNDSANQNMMFAFLNSEGAVDTTGGAGGLAIPTSGYLTLTNLGNNEYMTSMLQDGNGIVYVSGYTSTSTSPVAPGNVAATKAFIRAYSGFTSSDPAYNNFVVGSGYQGIGLGYQGFTDTAENRSLLCVAQSATTGSIYAYNNAGSPDLTFGDALSGSIAPTSYGLHMGPCYGLVTAKITAEAFIFAAYVDSLTNNVTVVKFQENGNGLIPGFGTAGTVVSPFGDVTIDPSNVRIGLLANDKLLVAAVDGTSNLYAVVVDATSGGLSAVLTQSITGQTLDALSRVTGVSDGRAMITFNGRNGDGDQVMYLARLNSLDGTLVPALDTTFNSQGAQPGVQPIRIGDQVADYAARTASYALIQSTPSTGNQGNIAVIGYESVTANDATPMAMRSYGTSLTTEVIDFPISVVEPGTFDFATDLFSEVGVGFGNVIFTYPSGNANDGYLLVGIDNGTTSKIARVLASDLTLGTFGTGGIYTVSPNSRGISTISIDAQNNILVGGTDTTSGSVGWAQVINNAGNVVTSLDMTGTNLTSVNKILQQQSGRYIVAGTHSTGKGIVVAFQDKLVGVATSFAIDPTFNPLLFGSVPYAGSFFVGTTAAAGLYAMAIQTANNTSPACQLDMIAVAYNLSGVAQVAQITADGDAFVFGPTATTLPTDSSATVQLNIDAYQNIVVAASYNSGGTHQVAARRYDCSGGTSSSGSHAPFTGAGVASGVITLPFSGSTSVTLTGVMETNTQQSVLTGYNTPAGSGTRANGDLFAARLVANGALDTIWNTSPIGSDYAGLLTYNSTGTSTPGQLNVNSASIALDGNVYSFGSSNPVAGLSHPIVSVVYGNNLVTQVSQNPLEVAAGIIDTTIPGGASGAALFGSVVTGVPQKIYEYNSPINGSGNGAMLVASVDVDQYAYVTQLNADLTLNSAHFGTAGVVRLDFGAGNAATITDMYVANGAGDTTQPIYVAGYTTAGATNTPFVVRIPSNGGTPTIAAPVSSLTKTGSIRQSTNGRVLVSGYNGTAGMIVAYNSAMTAIDTSFGNHSATSPNYGTGYYATITDNPIVAMTTDNTDRLYIAYQFNVTTINIDRVLENGTALDTSWGTLGTVTLSGTALSASQIKLAIDLTNNQLIVAAQDGTGVDNVIQLARFNLAAGAAAGTLSTITQAGAAGILNLADLFIDNDAAAASPFTAGAYPNIYVVGYTGGGNSIVARVATTSSAMALDGSYAAAGSPAGIANLPSGSMSVVNAGMLDLDRRVYLVGSNGSTAGYVARVFGDYYWTQASPAILQAAVGSVDPTLNPISGVAGVDLSVAAVTSAGWNTIFADNSYTAYAVIENPNNDGSVYVAFGDGVHVIVGQMNADLKPVTGFSADGLTAEQLMATVNSIAVDASGNIIVAGTSSGNLQTVYSYTSAGALNATFAAPTVVSVVGTVVAQQKSGRYIVGGKRNGVSGNVGLVSAYKNESAISGAVLPVDATFGASALDGYYQTAVPSQIEDLVIDSNDYIYIVYRNAGAVNVAKLTPEGCLSNSFNTPSGQQWSSNPMTGSFSITATQPARIAINSAGNILVGASVTGGITTQLINGSTGALIGATLIQTLSNTPVLTKLVGAGATSAPGAGTEFYGTYYNSVTAAGAYVFAVDNTGIIDPVFNSGAVLQLTGQTPSLTAGINGLSVQKDGKLVAVGANLAGDSGTTPQPILMRAYGYEYVAQFAQAPDQIGAGQLDTTLWPTTGAMELNNLTIGGSAATAFNTLIAAYAIKRVYEYGNGKMLFVADNDAGTGVNTVIFQLNKDLTLDSGFGGGTGYVVLLTNYGGTTGLFVDSPSSIANIYVTGNNAGAAWGKGFTNAGVALTPAFAFSGVIVEAEAFASTQIAQQSNGRIIVSGNTASSDGYILAYNNAGVLDASFGNDYPAHPGRTGLGGSNRHADDITIDRYDNILTVGNRAGFLNINFVSSIGTLVWGSITPPDIVGSPKIVLDNNNNIVVAAATSTGYIVQSYSYTFSSFTLTAIGSVAITVGTTPVLGNIYATNDGKITLVGYDSTTGNAITARLISGSVSLVLDTAAFNVALSGLGTPQAGVLVASLGAMDQVFDGIIHADDRIMLVGSHSASAAPYMGRVFGDDYVTYISQADLSQGVAGTLNPTFGNTVPPTGVYAINTLNHGLLDGAQGKAMLPLADGGFYMAFDNANTAANSILIKTLNSGLLDPSYNNTVGGNIPGIAGSATSPNYAPLGVNGILQDGSNNVVLVGTDAGAGWVQRYTSAGVLDTAFNGTGIINMATALSANAVVEQTSARLVVAGSNGSGAALFAYESLSPNGIPGSVDTTFNAGATGTPGYVQIGSTNAIYNLVADQYDRLIFAVLNSAGNAVDLYRLTPTGELDATFGTSGVKAGAIATAAGASSVRVAIDAAGNIIVAANSSTANTFSVRAFNNGTGTGSGSNGTPIYGPLNISSLTNSPSVTSLIASADGYALVGGIQSGTNNAWIARITAAGGLDTLGFNPNAVGSIAGIFQYAGAGDTSPAHVYNALAIRADGTIGMLGYENIGGTFNPNLVSVYDDPYTTQEPVSPDSKAVGSVDLTLGLGAYTNGIIYLGGTASGNQVARAVALYDDNNIVVAIDGANTAQPSNSSVFLNMFDTDGLANPGFGTAGTVTVLQGSTAPVSPNFQNQYIKDMITYTNAANVRKAIVAGYTYNSVLPAANQYSSLLFQYTLTPGSAALDTSFGGFNGSPHGLAFGDGKQLFSVGQQTTGRIIAAGLSQDNVGLLLGYTANGKLDMSFGNDGYQSVDTGSAGIYSHAIDTQNRIAIAYNNSGTGNVVRFLADGSALDGVTFGALSGTVVADDQMRVAVDSSNNVYAAAIVATSNSITVNAYNATSGATVHSVTKTGTQLGNATAVYTIARLIVDAAGNVIVVACDSDARQVVVIRLTSLLAFDSTFNAYNAVTNPAGVVGGGYVKYAINSGAGSQVATDAMVHPDGRIIIVGSES